MKLPLIDHDAIEQCAKEARVLFRVERDPFSLIHDLVHLWPGRSPIENRKKFAVPIRGLMREIRRRREHTNTLCAPGISRLRLP